MSKLPSFPILGLPEFLDKGVQYDLPGGVNMVYEISSPTMNRSTPVRMVASSTIGGPWQSNATFHERSESELESFFSGSPITPNTLTVAVFDLREAVNKSVSGKINFIALDKQKTTEKLFAEKFNVHDSQVIVQESYPRLSVFIIPPNMTEFTIAFMKHSDLEVDTDSGSDTSLPVFELTNNTIESVLFHPNIKTVETLINSGIKGQRKYQLVVNGKTLNKKAKVCNALKHFDIIHFLKPRELMVQVCFRRNASLASVFMVRSLTTNEVSQLKEQLKQVLSENGIKVDRHSRLVIMFGDKEIEDEKCLITMKYMYAVDEMRQCFKVSCVLHVVQPEDIHVHVLPLHNRKRNFRGKTTIFISPHLPTSSLREEVSKVISLDPAALKLMIGSKRIPEVRELKEVDFLKAGSNITPKLHKKKTFQVQICKGNAENETCSVSIYDCNSMRHIIARLAIELNVSGDLIDLYHAGKPLAPHETAKDLSLGQNSVLTAIIYQNRVQVRIWIPVQRKSHFLVIDQPEKTSVKDIAVFYALQLQVCIQKCKIIFRDSCLSMNTCLGELQMRNSDTLIITCIEVEPRTRQCGKEVVVVMCDRHPKECSLTAAVLHDQELHYKPGMEERRKPCECKCRDEHTKPVGIWTLEPPDQDNCGVDLDTSCPYSDGATGQSLVTSECDLSAVDASAEREGKGRERFEDEVTDIETTSVKHSSPKQTKAKKKTSGYETDSKINKKKILHRAKKLKAATDSESAKDEIKNRLLVQQNPCFMAAAQQSVVVTTASSNGATYQTTTSQSGSSYIVTEPDDFGQPVDGLIEKVDEKKQTLRYRHDNKVIEEKTMILRSYREMTEQENDAACLSDGAVDLLQKEIYKNGFSRGLLVSISNELGKDWLMLGRELDVSESRLTTIDSSHVQLNEKAFQMLHAWYKQKGHDASKGQLRDALIACRLNIIAHDHLRETDYQTE